MSVLTSTNGHAADETQLNRAKLESLSDAPPEKHRLSPTSALFSRSKPKAKRSSKSKSKRSGEAAQVEAVRDDELRIVTNADQPVDGADEVLDLADQLLDQLDVEEPALAASTSKIAPTPSDTSVSSLAASEATTEPSSPVSDFVHKLAHPFKSNRQQQRKERRAKEWEQQSAAAKQEIASSGKEDQAQKEKEAMDRQCAALGLVVVDIPPDGHCMFSAIADQLNVLGVSKPGKPLDHSAVRTAAAEYMRDHPDDFMPFLQPEEIGGEGDMTFDKFAHYCDQIAQTSLWGGQTEINALSHAYSVPIHVFTCDAPVLKVGDKDSEMPVRLAFYRSLYGLGEHYNSLHQRQPSEPVQ